MGRENPDKKVQVAGKGETADRGFRFGVRTIECDRATTLSDLVASHLASRSTSEPSRSTVPSRLNSLELIELGAVYINDERTLNASAPIRRGDRVRIHSSPRRFHPPPDLAALILAEDEASLLVEKPSGLPSGPVVDNLKENLLSFLEEMRGQRLHLTHQLSEESEGLLLVAKSIEAKDQIRRAFAEGRIERRYVGYVDAPIAIGPHWLDERRRLDVISCHEQRAETNLVTEGKKSWMVDGPPLRIIYRLELAFTNVRPKELRARLADIGSPVIGDRLYGSRHVLLDPASGKPTMALRPLSLALR